MILPAAAAAGWGVRGSMATVTQRQMNGKVLMMLVEAILIQSEEILELFFRTNDTDAQL